MKQREQGNKKKRFRERSLNKKKGEEEMDSFSTCVLPGGRVVEEICLSNEGKNHIRRKGNHEITRRKPVKG